jgi:hypothetical protein
LTLCVRCPWQEDVCASTAVWLRKVSYFADPEVVSVSFLVTITSNLDEFIYEPRESIRWNDCLNGISRGVGSVTGRVCPVGFIWGEDFVLESLELKDKSPVNALTFVTVLSLQRDKFFTLLRRFPIERRHIRRNTCLLAFRRAVFAYAYKNADDSSHFLGLVKNAAASDAIEGMVDKGGMERTRTESETPDPTADLTAGPTESSLNESSGAKAAMAASEQRLERKISDAVDRLTKEVAKAAQTTEAKLLEAMVSQQDRRCNCDHNFSGSGPLSLTRSCWLLSPGWAKGDSRCTHCQEPSRSPGPAACRLGRLVRRLARRALLHQRGLVDVGKAHRLSSFGAALQCEAQEGGSSRGLATCAAAHWH